MKRYLDTHVTMQGYGIGFIARLSNTCTVGVEKVFISGITITVLLSGRNLVGYIHSQFNIFLYINGVTLSHDSDKLAQTAIFLVVF